MSPSPSPYLTAETLPANRIETEPKQQQKLVKNKRKSLEVLIAIPNQWMYVHMYVHVARLDAIVAWPVLKTNPNPN